MLRTKLEQNPFCVLQRAVGPKDSLEDCFVWQRQTWELISAISTSLFITHAFLSLY